MSWSVLIVEDDPDIREMLVQLVATHGLEALAATNGLDAMELVIHQGVRPAVVVLDLAMPVMDGYEFLDWQREVPLLDGVPVIVLTARAHASRVTGLPATVRAVVEKPIPLFTLLGLIQEICGGSPRSGAPASSFANGSGALDAIDSQASGMGSEEVRARPRRRSYPTRPLRLQATRSDATHAVLLQQVDALRAAHPEVLEHAARIALSDPLLAVEGLSDEQLRDLLAAADDLIGAFR